VVAPQHGTFVAKLHYGDLSECMMIRRALEGDIAGLAAERRPPALLDSLERSLRYQAAAVAADDRDGFYALDVGFHEAILDNLGLVQARATLQGQRGHLERMRRLLTAPAGRLARTYAEHAAIGEAIASGDAEGARAAMRHHLAQTAAVFEHFAQGHSALFSDRT
jgi:DNA-binding GntR family transcriptional regulator